MVAVVGLNRQHSVKLCPVHPGFPVVYCGGRHDGLENMVGVDVLVGVKEAHAHVLLLVIAGISVPLKLQATPHSMSQALHSPWMPSVRCPWQTTGLQIGQELTQHMCGFV